MGKLAEIFGALILSGAMGYGVFKMMMAWAKGVDKKNEEKTEPPKTRSAGRSRTQGEDE